MDGQAEGAHGDDHGVARADLRELLRPRRGFDEERGDQFVLAHGVPLGAGEELADGDPARSRRGGELYDRVRCEERIGHFHESAGPEVDALEGYVLAVRRRQALDAGGFDRKFRFYRLADFDLCFRLRDRLGGRAVVVPDLPVVRHEHRLWEALSEEERERRSRRNYYRFLDLWGRRPDLMTRT